MMRRTHGYKQNRNRAGGVLTCCVRMSAETREDLQDFASLAGKSVTQVVEEALDAYITPHRPMIAKHREVVAEFQSAADPAREAAATLGRLGGQKGGVARAAALSPERRSEISRGAAEARWGKP